MKETWNKHDFACYYFRYACWNTFVYVWKIDNRIFYSYLQDSNVVFLISDVFLK